jgi:hypothetical protein
LDTILAKRVLRKIALACQDQNDQRVPPSGDTTETARLAIAPYPIGLTKDSFSSRTAAGSEFVDRVIFS